MVLEGFEVTNWQEEVVRYSVSAWGLKELALWVDGCFKYFSGRHQSSAIRGAGQRRRE
jgi:hypothetical protein